MLDHRPNHYVALGVPADADLRAIQRAFRARALDAHPDRGGDPEAFRRLRDAYGVLSDPTRRRAHDEALGIRRGGSVGAPGTGWGGRQGEFTGDVEFPNYLRDVVDGPWQARRAAAGPSVPTPRPVPVVDVAWMWPHRATTLPVAVGPLVVVPAGAVVSGIDPGSGLDAWRVDLGATVEARPVPVEGGVVVGLAGGSVEALDLASGAVRWQHQLGVPLATELAIWEGRVAVGAGGAVVALGTADGRRRWATRVAGPPVHAVVAGEHLVVTTGRGTIHGLDLDRGRQRWWVRATAAVDPAPRAVDDSVWLVSGGGRLVRLIAATGAVVATVDLGVAVAGLATHGRCLVASVAGPARMVAVDVDGVVQWTAALSAVSPEPTMSSAGWVVVEPTGVLRVLDRAHGAESAVARLPLDPVGAPLVAGSLLVVGDRRGTIWATAAPAAVASW